MFAAAEYFPQSRIARAGQLPSNRHGRRARFKRPCTPIAACDPVMGDIKYVRGQDDDLQHLVLVGMAAAAARIIRMRSEEHTSELQSLMRISYAVFCLKKNTHTAHTQHITKTIKHPLQ